MVILNTQSYSSVWQDLGISEGNRRCSWTEQDIQLYHGHGYHHRLHHHGQGWHANTSHPWL